MRTGAFADVIQRLQAIDAVIAASFYFGLNQNNHTLSLGLLISWIGIRCSQQIWKSRNDKACAEKTLPSILIFGLTTFHARSIIRLDDNPGGSIYILIGAMLYTGSLYSIQQKKVLLRWISGAALAIHSKILLEGIAVGENLLNKTWMASINNSMLEMGFGRINSLASMIAFFTIIALYGLRTEKHPAARALHAATFVSGYFLCWQSNSEMALGAPLIAAAASFLACRKDYFCKTLSRNFRLAIIGTTVLTGLISAWHLSFKDKFLFTANNGNFLNPSETWRVEQWHCWLNNSIFAGNNKIVHGIGFNLEEITQLCNNNNPDGGLTQFISQHGLLGILALAVLLIFTSKSIAQLRESEKKLTCKSKLLRCRWSEVAIGTIATVLLCNLITPSYSGGYFNASLTGLIFSLGIYTSRPKESIA